MTEKADGWSKYEKSGVWKKHSKGAQVAEVGYNPHRNVYWWWAKGDKTGETLRLEEAKNASEQALTEQAEWELEDPAQWRSNWERRKDGEQIALVYRDSDGYGWWAQLDREDGHERYAQGTAPTMAEAQEAADGVLALWL